MKLKHLLRVASLLALAVAASAESPFPGVLPKPRTYREIGDPILLAGPQQPVAIQVFGDDPVLRTAREELTRRIQSLGGRVIIADQRASIGIGVVSDWPTRDGLPASGMVPQRPQGYALSVIAGEPATKTAIAIRGSDATGAYYGVQTLTQLLDRTEEGVTVRRAEVVDWPTFTFRSFKGQCWYYRDNRMYVEWAPHFKWNVFGPCYTDSPEWRESPESYRRMIGDLCETANRTRAIRIMQLGNPYMLKERAIRATADGDIEALAEFFELSLSRGSDVLMLCLDDFAYLPEEDRGEFKTLAGANASIVTRFAERIWTRHPSTRILVCPPPYWLTANQRDNYKWAHDYLRDFSAHIPPEIPIVWTGREVTTLCHEPSDIEAYQALVGPQRPLFLWDNTLKMPPGWGNVFRMNPFLAACDDIAGSAWPKMADFTRGEAVINTYGPGEIYKVPLMTAADYLWNPESYDPQDSLRRALYWFDENREVGPMLARWVNDLHQQLYTKRLAFLKSPSKAGLDEMESLTREYLTFHDRIVSATENQQLIAELKPYLQRHTDFLPILTDVFAGYEKRETAPDEAHKLLQDAEKAATDLTAKLAKGDLDGDQHGLVRNTLETETLKAIRALLST